MPGDRDRFIALGKIAVVGASRDRRKYGNVVYRRLRDKGTAVFAVNRAAATVEGDPVYPSLRDLPGPVDGVVIVVPPEETEAVVRDAAAAGIRMVWMQPGAESRRAIRFCEENGICAVHDACILVEMGKADFG